MDFNIYKGNYTRLMFVPAALLVACLLLVFVYPRISAGIDFSGGTRVIVRSDAPIDGDSLKELLSSRFALKDLSVSSVSSPAGYGAIFHYTSNPTLESASSEIAAAKSLLASDPATAKARAQAAAGLLSQYITVPNLSSLSPAATVSAAEDALSEAEKNFQVSIESAIKERFSPQGNLRFEKREVEPTLGRVFWENAILVAVVSCILVAIVIFVSFRELIPSLAVIAAASCDVAAALAGMALFGVSLSLPSIAVLLMLVGYSIDTDIMLTAKVLKRREMSASERTAGAMKTGLTMTTTTIAAVSVMLVFAYFVQMAVVFEMALILLPGLVMDIISTWLFNAPLLLWYVEHKKVKA